MLSLILLSAKSEAPEVKSLVSSLIPGLFPTPDFALASPSVAIFSTGLEGFLPLLKWVGALLLAVVSFFSFFMWNDLHVCIYIFSGSMVAVCTQWGDERAKKMAMISIGAVGDVEHGIVSYWSTTLKVCLYSLLLLTLQEIWFHLSTTKRFSAAEAKVIKVLTTYHKNTI